MSHLLLMIPTINFKIVFFFIKTHDPNKEELTQEEKLKLSVRAPMQVSGGLWLTEGPLGMKSSSIDFFVLRQPYVFDS